MSSSKPSAPAPQIIYMPAPVPPPLPVVPATPNAPPMQPGVAAQGQPQGGGSRRQGSFGVGSGGGDSGASSTMLAGASGVDPRLLAIGKNTLLGA